MGCPAFVAAILALGIFICASIYTSALLDVETAAALGNCSCEESNNQECSRNDTQFILTFVSDYQDNVTSSVLKLTFSKNIQSILHNYTGSSNGIIVGSSKIEVNPHSTVIEVIQEICSIVDVWSLWLAIGVLNIVGGILAGCIGIVCHYAIDEDDDDYDEDDDIFELIPGIILFVTTVPSFIMIFFTSAFSSSLLRNFPMLAKSAIALFAFCIPAGLVAIVIIVFAVIYRFCEDE